MKLSLLSKSISLAFSNLWRNKVLSVATIFVMGAIIFIFNIILAINFIAESALLDLNQKIDLTVYLKESTSVESAQAIANEISTLEGITSVHYTSKESALEQLKVNHPDLTLAFEKYGLSNPLPASLNITTETPELHVYVSNYLSDERFDSELSNIVSNETDNNAILSSVSENLIKLTEFTHQIIFWLIFTFVLGGTLIILNALQITIFNRKKEISVMKLVGASHSFIRSPFLIESVMYAISATILSFIMLLILSQKITIEGTSVWQYYENLNFAKIFLAEILVAIGLSVISSLIAMNEYIKKDLLED
jgi:cell division transport system permease protein